jgi:hypothetical protein
MRFQPLIYAHPPRSIPVQPMFENLHRGSRRDHRNRLAEGRRRLRREANRWPCGSGVRTATGALSRRRKAKRRRCSREDRPSRTTTGPWLWPLDAPVRPISHGTKAVERGRSGREDAARGRRATGILKLKELVPAPLLFDSAIVRGPEAPGDHARCLSRRSGVGQGRDRYPLTPFSWKYFSAPGWNGIGERSWTWFSSENASASLWTATSSAFFSITVLTML